ncbi:hypothetical protein [Candidatus Spongiihabitans sp.]|uniref:hypothetical protein n=1 Tax=Candidatus Spongiihabitans sp. TaxID=3101308 RepID=UPI003C7E1EEB
MSVDAEKVDTLLQYILLVAGSLDARMDRGLGPIHLIKYVYLSDLAYAEHNQGKTLTGVRWQFYKFGPWSQEVNARINPALNQIHATRTDFTSDYGNDDWCRWKLESNGLLEEKERLLPLAARIRLPREIKNFAHDTPDLLDYVYKTGPMLSAKPMKYLDFHLAYSANLNIQDSQPTKYSVLSKGKKKRLAERMESLKKSRKEQQKPKLVCPVSSQRYDEVYKEGIKWLASLAGPKFSDTTMDVQFSDEVWNSMARKGDDLS